jgi:predicted amidohydrolase
MFALHVPGTYPTRREERGLDTIRVCLLKVMPAKGDLVGNMDKLERVIAEIPGCGIDVMVAPEGYLDGYVSTEEGVGAGTIAQYGVQERSEYLDRAARIAAQHAAWFVFGCIHNTREGPRNAALIFNRQGELAGRYYKVHCQTHDHKYVAGETLPVFEAEFGRFGVMICADRRWPETVRTLALQGARVIFNPTYGMHGERNRQMMQVRSYESEVYICFAHPQQSLITGPKGDVEAVLVSSQDHYLIHDLDLSTVDRVRGGPSAHLRDRRPDVYWQGP